MVSDIDADALLESLTSWSCDQFCSCDPFCTDRLFQLSYLDGAELVSNADVSASSPQAPFAYARRFLSLSLSKFPHYSLAFPSGSDRRFVLSCVHSYACSVW